MGEGLPGGVTKNTPQGKGGGENSKYEILAFGIDLPLPDAIPSNGGTRDKYRRGHSAPERGS